MRQNLSAPLATSSAGAAGRHGAVPRGAAHTGAAASQKHRTNVPAPGAHAACRSPPAAGHRLPSGRGCGSRDARIPAASPRPDGRGPRRRPPLRRPRPAPRGHRSPPPAGGALQPRVHPQRRPGARCRPPGPCPPADRMAGAAAHRLRLSAARTRSSRSESAPQTEREWEPRPLPSHTLPEPRLPPVLPLAAGDRGRARPEGA